MGESRRRTPLGRTSIEMPAVVWDLDGSIATVDHIEAAAGYGYDWFLRSLPWGRLCYFSETSAIVRLELEEAVGLAQPRLHDRFRAMPSDRLRGVMLCGASGGDIKAGRAFHRLASIRDAGLCDAILIEANDSDSAEWFVENTPIDGISVRYDLADQSARYRVLPMATELGIAVLARAGTGQQSVDDFRLRIHDSLVASAIAPLPTDGASLGMVHQILNETPDEAKWAGVWEEFRSRVPEPTRPRGQHPPEYEA